MKYFLFISLFCFPHLSGAQNLLHPDTRFDNFSERYNFSRQFCGDVITDSSGYVWAFANGLYRFDGQRVKHYINYKSEEHGLRDNYVEHPVVDGAGRIWFGSGAGIAYYNAATDRFVYAQPESNTPAYSISILGNELFFRNNEGLCRLQLQTGAIKKTSLRVNSTWLTYPTKRSEIVVCTDVNYYLYQPATDRYTRHEMRLNGQLVRIKDIVYARGEYWLATNSGLWHTPNFSQAPEPVAGTAKLNIRCLALLPKYTGDSLLWLGSGGEGLQVFSLGTKKTLYVFQHKKGNPYSICSNNIISLHPDKVQRLWISTENGISLLNPGNQFFRMHRMETQETQSTFRFLQNMIPDKKDSNIVWVNMVDRGLVQFDWARKQPLREFAISPPGEASAYKKSFLYALPLGAQTWALANIDRLVYWHEQKGILQTVTQFHLPAQLPQLIIRQLLQLGDTLYLCTNNGLLRHIRGRPEGEYIFYDDKTKEYSAYNLLGGVYSHTQNTIWMAAYNGITAYTPGTGKIASYYNPDADSLNSNVVFNIDQGPNEQLLCALRNGIAQFNTATKTFTTVHRFGNITNPQCYGLVVRNKTWYINSNAGLLRYQPETGSVSVINGSTPFTLDYSLKNFYPVHNYLVVGFSDAFAYFDPDELPTVMLPTAPILETVSMNGKRMALTQPGLLRHRQNNLEVSFTAFNYENPENIRFRYRLLPRDTGWQEALPGQRSASYRQLPPGRYMFEVQSGNQYGNWNYEIAAYSFRIRPAFWQTILFRVMAGLLLLLLAVLFYRNRVGRLRKKQREQAQLQQLELEQYKQQLELEQVTAFFSGSLVDKNNVSDVLGDVAKNLIGKLGFEDCMIYLWNTGKTQLLQYAGHGKKGAIEHQPNQEQYAIPAGEGIVGASVAMGKPILVNDTTADKRYIHLDGIVRLSELCVPLVHNGEVLGAINIEHSNKDAFTSRHLQTVSTIATLAANKIKAIEHQQSLHRKELELSVASRQLAETELAMLRSQMNPHFIFNSLNSIQKYIWENREEDAAEYLASFAKLMRAILEHSRHTAITLAEEMSAMKLYVDLERRRSNMNFDYYISISEQLEPGTVMVPPLLLQPFIENAIWHGLSRKKERGMLNISIQRAQNQLVCVVDDDGVGRPQTGQAPTGRKSLGIEITR
ncbi:MAG: histidine kinase, partial [Dinghuibacter sp.]|nr:histidine kinase [Dinghuibacter sp.]